MLQSLDKYSLNPDTLNALENYSTLMLKWNSRIQLTATRDFEEFIGRHVADSIELAKLLPARGRLLDVGSGGGLPGLVVAIVCPELALTLIEPIKKKHAFLSTARRELALPNVTTYALRDEELLAREDFVPFDMVVARAVWSLDVWLERGKRLIGPGGTIYGMEGKDEEQVPPNARRHQYSLEKGRVRSIVSLTVE